MNFKMLMLTWVLGLGVINGSLTAQSSIYTGYPQVNGEFPINEFKWAPEFFPRVPGLPEIQGPIGILYDHESGIVLYEKNIDEPIPPASLTKLMTLHLLRSSAEEQGLGLDDEVQYSEAAYAVNAPPRSSLMFLEAGHRTTLRDLLLGLAVSSGNDAAIAAAEVASGSVARFVDQMNQEAGRLGLQNTYFEEPSGYSQYNLTTARDFARFLGYYLHRWPESLGLYHSALNFTYPRRENLTLGATSRFLGVTQPNRNGLVGSYEGADGLKTGYIEESGYNLAFTAERDGFRLVGLVLGVQAPTPIEGSLIRQVDAQKLLDFGFQNFVPRTLTLPGSQEIRLWKGEQKSLFLEEQQVRLPLPINLSQIEIRRTLPSELQAPLTQGGILGYQEIANSQGVVLGTIPLRIPRSIGESRGIGLEWDRLVLFVREFFGIPQPLGLE
ncbi:MAG: D-alanyl-D-alanine carboxypeptidase [Spirochaetales bacterium]|nr:D-alanyl-D-alanine carboxypeptidase [Spirochaetales bacterium]